MKQGARHDKGNAKTQFARRTPNVLPPQGREQSADTSERERKENLATAQRRSGARYQSASGTLPVPCERDYLHGHGRGRRLPILAFISHDPTRRYRAVDLELHRPQQHLGSSGLTRRVVELWNS
jgi:hypothetical protein